MSDEPLPTPIEATGLLQRDGGGFILTCDGGGSFRLRLRRVPVDHVEKRVRLSGVERDGVLEVERLSRA